MAKLIEIYQCDFCGAIAAIKSETEMAVFNTFWFSEKNTHLCLGCRYKRSPKAKSTPPVNSLLGGVYVS